ncbi:MAG: hypothetical protein WCK29_00295 [archaeon]
MSTEIEYEKTYLLKQIPDGIDKTKSVLIRDIYIPETADHAHLRLRQKDDKYVITKKHKAFGEDASMQYEHTIDLDKDEFMALAICSVKDFVKRRYFVEYRGCQAEIDIYQERLSGLALADFEFNNEKDKDEFETPDFALADVTQDESIAGGFLAGKTYEDIAPLIEKYGYKKLEIKL